MPFGFPLLVACSAAVQPAVHPPSPWLELFTAPLTAYCACGHTNACMRFNTCASTRIHSCLPEAGSLCCVSVHVVEEGRESFAACLPCCFVHTQRYPRACLFDGIVWPAFYTAAPLAECVLALLPLRLPLINTNVHAWTLVMRTLGHTSAQVCVHTPNPACAEVHMHRQQKCTSMMVLTVSKSAFTNSLPSFTSLGYLPCFSNGTSLLLPSISPSLCSVGQECIWKDSKSKLGQQQGKLSYQVSEQEGPCSIRHHASIFQQRHHAWVRCVALRHPFL